MIAVELSPDSIVIDIDAETGTVTLTEIPADLAQIGIGAGTVCSTINGRLAASMLVEGALTLDKPMEWVFALADRTVQLFIVFKDEITESVSDVRPESSNVDEAISADFVGETPEAVRDPNADTAWRDPRSVLENLEYPIEDAAHRVRDRPPRPLINNWKGWWSEPDDPPKEWWMT
jgi:hypothetical protein